MDGTSENRNSGKIPQFIIYTFLWLFFLIIPVITNNYGTKGEFKRICFDWLRMLPFFFIFLINSFLLLPKLLFKARTKLYIASLIVIAVVISYSFESASAWMFRNDPKLMERRILLDPQYGREEMKPGGLPQDNSQARIFTAPDDQALYLSRRAPQPGQPLVQFINTFFICLLISGFNTSIAMTNRWVAEEQARKEIEQERIRSELAFLQNQVSPHFFMNTLNNIHALIEQDNQLAQNAVLRLSALMRYLLYESGRGTTTLRREVDFLKSYINLMRLRFDECVRIEMDFPENFIDLNLPPLLFISFVENAFKHGVSYKAPSSLKFMLVRNSDTVEFMAENTVQEKTGVTGSYDGGIGLENIRKRLGMLYGDRYSLLIENDEKLYRVTVTIPV